MENNNWDLNIQKVANILESKEKYQKVLGRIAFNIAQEYSLESLTDFALEIKETHGVVVSPATLKNYEYVYRITKDLMIPPDLSYRTMQYIASSGKPQYWADRINNEGLSSSEVYRLIREEKGLDKPKIKVIICDKCGNQISLS